jgi:hypothetical protein
VRIQLPNRWQPRPYQRAAWDYLEAGGKRAVVVAHRRWGKDEIALHHTAVAAHLKVGTYWHMLPEASQARKAIWNAINPHTGMRRIDEAFPVELRETTLNNEMFIRFKNGSTWQVVGSDNFNSLVGSPPVGVVFSEYSIANPRSWGILRPILLENGGWALFIYTPRGKNHGHALLQSAKEGERWFSEVSPVSKTKAIPAEALAEELREMIRENGEEFGRSLYMQEWECSFEAAILGAFYGLDMVRAQETGRIGSVPYQPQLPTYTAWDLGYRDDTAIWFYQMVRGEVHVIDFEARSGLNIADLAKIVIDKPYHYAKHYLPHDARAKTLSSGGKSIIEQLAEHLGLANLTVVPEIGLQNGIQAVRMMLPNVWFDDANCADGLEALRQYQREYDDDKRAFRESPRHDWTSHPADAFRMLAVAWGNEPKPIKVDPSRPLIVGGLNQATMNDMWAGMQAKARSRI